MNANSDGHNIARAAGVLRNGEVIAYPTEGVWGLGCDPMVESAVEKILVLKERPVDKGLILIASSAMQFARFLEGLDNVQLCLFESKQNKPTTWLVPHNGVAPPWIVGEHDTLALRITEHPIASAICESFGGPIVSTSANPQNFPPAETFDAVADYFFEQIAFSIPGHIGDAQGASEIKDIITGEVIRAG